MRYRGQHQWKLPIDNKRHGFARDRVRHVAGERTAVNPAMSMQVRNAGTRDTGLYVWQSHSKRESGTGIRASSGLMVAYGKFAALPRSTNKLSDFAIKKNSTYRSQTRR